MDKSQVGQIMMMIEASFNNRLKSNNPNLTFNIYVDMLKDYDYSYVINNLKYHIQHSQFPPTIHDLITDKAKSDRNGRYIPDFTETKRNLMQIEATKALALTTQVSKSNNEEILAAKEKALKTIAEAIERSKLEME